MKQLVSIVQINEDIHRDVNVTSLTKEECSYVLIALHKLSEDLKEYINKMHNEGE